MGATTGFWECRKCGIKFKDKKKYNTHYWNYHATGGPHKTPHSNWPGIMAQAAMGTDSGEITQGDIDTAPEIRETVMSVLLDLLSEKKVPTDIRLQYSMRILRMIKDNE